MHSGLLFLFPHIYKVCMAADVCGTLDFGVNVFLKGGPAEGLALLPIGDIDELPLYTECATVVQDPEDMVHYWPRVGAVMVSCMIWGAGTAVGEIPPYYLALKAGGEEALADEMESNFATIEGMKKWTVNVVKRWGFLAVFLLASWPNAFFDLCGLCCGVIQMPFLTFFAATFLGKAVVKVGLQSMFFVLIFTKQTFAMVTAVVSALAEAVMPGDRGKEFGDYLNQLAEQQLERFKHADHSGKQAPHSASVINLI
eukprot:gene7636-11701_t